VLALDIFVPQFAGFDRILNQLSEPENASTTDPTFAENERRLCWNTWFIRSRNRYQRNMNAIAVVQMAAMLVIKSAAQAGIGVYAARNSPTPAMPTTAPAAMTIPPTTTIAVAIAAKRDAFRASSANKRS
jgi:hypothetical protein